MKGFILSIIQINFSALFTNLFPSYDNNHCHENLLYWWKAIQNYVIVESVVLSPEMQEETVKKDVQRFGNLNLSLCKPPQEHVLFPSRL